MQEQIGKVARRSELLNSTDANWLLAQVPLLLSEAQSGSGFSKQCIILLSSSKIQSVKDAAQAALQRVS